MAIPSAAPIAAPAGIVLGGGIEAARPTVQSVHTVDAISEAANKAQAARETSGQAKAEGAFQGRSQKKPEVMNKADSHLRNAQDGLKGKLAQNERDLEALRAQAAAAPGDPDLQAEYDAAVVEHNANIQLYKSYEASQVNSDPAHPKRADAVQKLGMLRVYQQDLLAQLNTTPDYDPRHAQIAQQLTDVGLSIYNIDKMVHNEPGVIAKGKQVAKVVVCSLVGINIPSTGAEAQFFAQDVIGKASIVNDIKLAAVRSLADTGRYPTPEADLVFARAAEANARMAGVTPELRGAACDLLAAKRIAITADAAKVDADKAAKAQRDAARQAQPAVAVGEAKAPQAAATAAEAKQAAVPTAEEAAAAKAKAEREAFVKANGPGALVQLRALGINFDGTNQAQVLDQLLKLADTQTAGIDMTQAAQLVDAAWQINADINDAQALRAKTPNEKIIPAIPIDPNTAQAKYDSYSPKAKASFAKMCQQAGIALIVAGGSVPAPNEKTA